MKLFERLRRSTEQFQKKVTLMRKNCVNIVEHWDVLQTMPEAANNMNAMF